MKKVPPKIDSKFGLEFINNPHLHRLEYLKQFDNISCLKFPFLRAYIITDPALVKEMLQDKHRLYIKGRAYRILSNLLGKGLVTSEGDTWKQHRKMAQPSFHKKRLELLSNIVVGASQKSMQRMEQHSSEKHFDFSREMASLTIEIVSKALFGTTISTEMVNTAWDEVYIAQNWAIDQIQSPFNLPLWFPSPKNRRFKKATQRIEKIILEIIQSRRDSSEEHDDLLQMLLDARYENSDQGMSDQQLKDEIITLFLAGHETTVNAISWTIIELSKRPEIIQKVRKELDEVLQDRTPSLEDAFKLPYLANVLNESMRIHPPIHTFSRHSSQDDSLGNYAIKKNSEVLISVACLHMHPKYWNEPETFKPERFENLDMHGDLKYIFFPFGGGPRKCIGNNFAMTEMLIILAMFLRKFDYELPNPEKIEHEYLVTLKPKQGVHIKLNKLT